MHFGIRHVFLIEKCLYVLFGCFGEIPVKYHSLIVSEDFMVLLFNGSADAVAQRKADHQQRTTACYADHGDAHSANIHADIA